MRVNIQGAVNNALATASVMSHIASQSPAMKKRAEAKNLAKAQDTVKQKLTAHIESSRGLTGASQDELETRFKTQRELGGELEGIKKRMFDLNPTKENYDAYVGVKNVNQGMDSRWAQIQDAKRKAIEHMEASQEEKRNRVPVYGARGEVING